MTVGDDTSDALTAATIGRRASGAIAAAAAVAALASYAVLAVIARALSVADNSLFLTFWGALFSLYGALGGVQNELTRSVQARRRDVASAVSRESARAFDIGARSGLALVAGVALTSPVWAHALYGAHAAWLAGAMCVGTIAYALHATLMGALSGAGRWHALAGVVAGEAMLRLVLVVAVAALVSAGAQRVNAFALAAAAASALWLVLLATRVARSAFTQRTDRPRRIVLRNVLHACAATACTGLLVVGFPVLMRLTSSHAEFAHAAPLILAVALTRAPLLLPLGVYQGVAIAHVVRHRHLGIRALAPALRLLTLLGVLAAPVAALLGPPVLRLLRPDYLVGSATFAALTLAALAIALVTMTGTACLALDHHRIYAAGWIVATIVSVAALALPSAMTERVLIALIAGPVVGMLIHVSALRSRSSASAAERVPGKVAK